MRTFQNTLISPPTLVLLYFGGQTALKTDTCKFQICCGLPQNQPECANRLDIGLAYTPIPTNSMIQHNTRTPQSYGQCYLKNQTYCGTESPYIWIRWRKNRSSILPTLQTNSCDSAFTCTNSTLKSYVASVSSTRRLKLYPGLQPTAKIQDRSKTASSY